MTGTTAVDHRMFGLAETLVIDFKRPATNAHLANKLSGPSRCSVDLRRRAM